MIMAREIRAALSDLLKSRAGLPYEVHFDLNREASRSYLYVEVSERRETVDPVYYDRILKVEVQLILLPDAYGRIHRRELFDARDRLDLAIRPVLAVGDRRITVQETHSRILDGILHYWFRLGFTDYIPLPAREDGSPIHGLMEHLDARLAARDNVFVFDAEEE